MAMHLIINVIYSLHKFRWSPLASHAPVWYMSPVEKFARMTYIDDRSVLYLLIFVSSTHDGLSVIVYGGV